MPARTNRIRHDDATRAKIRTSQLINRLTANALGTVDLNPSQVRSIEILLKKTLPDLAAIELSGKDGKAIEMIITGVPRAADDHA